MAIVNGNSVIFETADARGNYRPFACARGVTINMVSDLVGKSTIGSGDWKEKEVTALDWNFSCDGVIYLSKDGFTDTVNFIQLWINKTAVNIKFIITDKTGGNIQMAGAVIINAVSPSGAVNNAAGVNITGEGTGALWTNTSFVITNEQPNFPITGQTTLTFGFDSYPGATAYTIRTTNLLTGQTTQDTGGPAPRDLVVSNGFNYSFALRYEPDGFFGYEIFWPVIPPPPILINAFWGWQAAPFTPATLPGFAFQASDTFLSNEPILADYNSAPDGSYLALKYPFSNLPKTKWT